MSGPVFEDNEGGGRWGRNRGIMGDQAGRDDAAKVGVSRQGVHIQLSCPHCSSVFVADEAEAKNFAQQDPDDLRAESVVISWEEIKGMAQGSINTPRLHKTTGGYQLIEVCDVCARHYQKRGLTINPQGQPPHLAQQAMQRRKEVSAIRPLPLNAILRWLEVGRRAGVVV